MKETGYLLQAVLVLAWWAGLYLSETFFGMFQYPHLGPQAFLSLLLPDLVLIGGLSLLRTYWSAKPLEWIILGAFAYATLFCVNASFVSRAGWLPTTTMLVGLAYNFLLCSEASTFRASSTSKAWLNGLKTIVQIICVWSLTLVLIPSVIIAAEGSALSLNGGFLTFIGIALFVIASCLGLWSSYIMVTQGQGTPLPLDQTNRLVVGGPYRWVRNPMAVAGIGQGVAVALAAQSWFVFGYALLGAVVWQFVVRPIEERDLESRFGQEYLDYRKRVRCWIPVEKNRGETKI